MKYVALFLMMVSVAVSAGTPYVWKSSTTVPQETVQAAARIASQSTRYPIPDSLPIAVVMTSAEMEALVPNAYGLVAYKDPTRIMLNVDIPSDLRFAVLVHEMVHIMQIHAGRIPVDCHSNMANELEAYAASAGFLARSGNTHVPVSVNFRCP